MEDVKVFIGTKAVSEGLDFKELDKYILLIMVYLSKHSQIIGRAIRKQSHTVYYQKKMLKYINIHL